MKFLVALLILLNGMNQWHVIIASSSSCSAGLPQKDGLVAKLLLEKERDQNINYIKNRLDYFEGAGREFLETLTTAIFGRIDELSYKIDELLSRVKQLGDCCNGSSPAGII